MQEGELSRSFSAAAGPLFYKERTPALDGGHTEIAVYEWCLDHPTLSREEEYQVFVAWRELRQSGVCPTAQDIRESSLLDQCIATRPPAERQQWQRIFDEGLTAEQLVIRCYQQWCLRVARSVRALGRFSLEERHLKAQDGFLQVIQNFDPQRGNRVTTFTAPYMIAAIQAAECASLHISGRARQTLHAIAYYSIGYKEEFGRRPSRASLRRQLIANADGREGRPRVPPRSTDRYIDLFYEICELAEPHELTGRIESPIFRHRRASVEEERASAALMRLSPFQQKIVSAVLGLEGLPQGFALLASRYQTSEAEVRSVYEAAITAMRAELSDNVAQYDLIEKTFRNSPTVRAVARLALEHPEITRPDAAVRLNVTRQRIAKCCEVLHKEGFAAPMTIRWRPVMEGGEQGLTERIKRGESIAGLSDMLGTTQESIRRQLKVEEKRRRGGLTTEEALREAAQNEETRRMREWALHHPFRAIRLEEKGDQVWPF